MSVAGLSIGSGPVRGLHLGADRSTRRNGKCGQRAGRGVACAAQQQSRPARSCGVEGVASLGRLAAGAPAAGAGAGPRLVRCSVVADAAAAGQGSTGQGGIEDQKGESKAKLIARTVLISSFVLWYAGNIAFNIYNKRLLIVMPFPITISTLQMGVGALVGWLTWRSGIVKQPEFTRDQLLACVPLALFHAFTNTLMLTSLSKIAVSLTHTIRATEPLFVTLAAMFVLGTRPRASLIWSLVPIVVGVSVASATDVSFSWVGFLAAMGSNVASTMRNVYSKQVMSGVRGNIDSVSLLTLVNFGAFCMLVPLCALAESPAISALLASPDPAAVAWLALLSAILLQSYQQVSYNILSKVSAVTHSVANCVKRVVVIVAAVAFFHHPMGVTNAVGTALTLGGVFAYSLVKVRDKERRKLAQRAAEEAERGGAAAAAAALLPAQ